jgi:5-methylcytosine-specific restriction enzyme A
MRRTLRPCLEPGCPELTQTGRCKAHARQAEARWKDPARRKVYNSRRWRAMRSRVLKEQPFCQAPGCNNLATDVDHVTALADDGDPYDRSNLQALCKMHHSQKTRQEIWGRK